MAAPLLDRLCKFQSESRDSCRFFRVSSLQYSCCVADRLPGCATPANLFEDLGGGFVVAVLVVPIPPLVRQRLRVALRRVLPLLLTPEGSDVEVVPSVPHLFVTAAVDKVGAEHVVTIADERVRAVPLVHA